MSGVALHWQKWTPSFAAVVCLHYGFFFIVRNLREILFGAQTCTIMACKKTSVHVMQLQA